jgi:hypothetical protein
MRQTPALQRAAKKIPYPFLNGYIGKKIHHTNDNFFIKLPQLSGVVQTRLHRLSATHRFIPQNISPQPGSFYYYLEYT